MNWVRQKYYGLDGREKKQLWFIIGLSLLASYFFFSAWLWQQMFDAEKMANRRANRIETRIGKIEPPRLQDGVSEGVLKAETEHQKVLEEQLKALAGNLLPLDNAGIREQFKLELAQLAETNNMRVNRVKALNAGLRPSLSELSGEALREYLTKRPEFDLVVTGYFLNLVHFISGLQHLSYGAYVTDMTIKPEETADGRLMIQLRIKI